MESANEAGRRAARAILLEAGKDPACVRLFGYDEVDRFRIPKRLDEWLHARGKPHVLTLIRRFAETRLGRAPQGRKTARPA